MKLTLIAALDAEGVIGCQTGGVPWPPVEEDSRHLRTVCAGQWLLIGRQTYDEMRGWFGKLSAPSRVIVISRDERFMSQAKDGEVTRVASVELAQQIMAEKKIERVIVLGGASVFAATLGLADEMVLTQFGFRSGGDIYFPEWKKSDWRVVERHDFDDPVAGAWSITRWQRWSREPSTLG
jgi:dihydrofolate reductase